MVDEQLILHNTFILPLIIYILRRADSVQKIRILFRGLCHAKRKMISKIIYVFGLLAQVFAIGHAYISRPLQNTPGKRFQFYVSSVSASSGIAEVDPLSLTSENNNIQCERFDPSKLGITFAENLLELERYREKNGDCLVPKRYSANPALGNWVNKQRQNYRKFLDGKASPLNETRIEALNSVGFVWNASATRSKTRHSDRVWQNMFSELSAFKQWNGHCRVVSSSKLGQWVVRQRFLYRQYPTYDGSQPLSQDRIYQLNSIDFPWSTRWEDLWEKRVNELREFKRNHENCAVPRKYPDNPTLATWVASQRKHYNRRLAGKQSPLTAERIKELDEIGFIWDFWDYNFMRKEQEYLKDDGDLF